MSITNIFSNFFKRTSSKEVAKERLKLVLIHDRADCVSCCSTEVLEMMRNDIIQVIAKYMEIDKDKLDIQISKTSSGNTLSACFPIVSMKKIDS
jgi:cell division topological specificity factor